MHSSLVFKAGLLIFLLAFLYLMAVEFVLHADDDEMEYKVYPLFKKMLIAGGAVLALSLFIKLLESMGILGGKSKCIRCGKKVPRGHIYCDAHKLEVAEEFKQESRKRSR